MIIFILKLIKYGGELGVISVLDSLQQHDEQKLNWQQEANQPADGKGMDEKEDFLHQIRTKVSLFFHYDLVAFHNLSYMKLLVYHLCGIIWNGKPKAQRRDQRFYNLDYGGAVCTSNMAECMIYLNI